MLENEGLILLC